MENWTNLDKVREGVKNPGNFADIICIGPLMTLSILGAILIILLTITAADNTDKFCFLYFLIIICV